ncbi:DNA topoisomerase 2 [Rhizina undulata]
MESEKHRDALQEGLVNKFKLSKTVTKTNLVAFDPEGRITKYESSEDIIKSFYYDYVIADLNKQLLKLSNQGHFIQMICNKELVISGKKRSIIIAELKAKNFDTFSKKKEA